jgi:hypothetical protein
MLLNLSDITHERHQENTMKYDIPPAKKGRKSLLKMETRKSIDGKRLLIGLK